MGGWFMGGVYSHDGSKIHLVINSDWTPTVVTLDAATGDYLGTAPALALIPPYDEISPSFEVSTPFGADDSGLVFGWTDHGVAIEDALFYQNLGTFQGNPSTDKLVQPDVGPLNAATAVKFQTSPFFMLSSVWFGDQPSSHTFLDSGNYLWATAPPTAVVGPVNVKVLDPNGIQIFNPLAFTYGPYLLYLSGDTASPSGGAVAHLYGLGLPLDPSQVQVRIGGSVAQVTNAAKQDLGPFPTEHLTFTVPPGVPGSADVTVTTPVGSHTLARAFHYATSVTDYAVNDPLQAAVYDRVRQKIYLSAGDHVDVFSLTAKAFVSPFAPPALNGPAQFGGLALTPDGSRLLIGNLHDGSVVILDPDNPSAASVVAVSPQQLTPCVTGPASIAVTSTNQALVITGAAPSTNCGPGGSIYKLDLVTLTANPVNAYYSMECGPAYVSAPRDGKTLGLGGTHYCTYDSGSDTFVAFDFIPYPHGIAASGDGNVFAAMWSITDPAGNFIGRVALPDIHYSLALANYGNVSSLQEEKLNDSGSLLYMPRDAHHIDLFDVQHGVFSRRITLTQTVQNVLDAMAITPDGDQIFLITDKGLTVVQLGAAPLSVGSVAPSAAPSGTLITLRGSGFAPGTSATCNGSSATLVYVDASTLQLTVPPLTSGAVRVELTNPDGTTYALDNAFVVP